MKTAMWAVFIFILGIVGVVLINIFGNITTTNQQDYTLIKNTVEASMYDAIDVASYRAGFYVCTNEASLTFTNKDNYKIINRQANFDYNEFLKEYSNCQELIGEVKILSDVFEESFLRRFAESINNSKSYKVTIQEIIEYPPKVSVRVDTYNTYNSTDSTTYEFNEGDFQISNRIDAILEDKREGDLK